ncbi:MAG: helicase-associated domain-containing protein [Candidatus Planktophila sp.]|nr:helicase-associated domain-containing protein [Candidatus Planktophila sp.]
MEIRSYADYLRSLDDAALFALFEGRSDLTSPVPSDIASLAVRASSIPSLVRAIDSLNKWQLQVLEAAAVLAEPFTEKELLQHTDKSAKFALSALTDRALIYLGHDGYRIPNNVRDVLGNEIAGLGTPALKKLKLKDLAEAPAASKKVLDAMVWGPPRGAVADVKKPNPGLKWLLDQGFVSPVNQQTVVLHREVALLLRGNKVHRELLVAQPEITGRKVEAKSLQLAAISNITTFLRWVEELLNFWGQEPAMALKAGGIGVRDLRDLTQHLGVETECASFIIEVAYISGLVTIDPDDRVLPTHQFDIWLAQPASVKWENLLSAWLITSRMSGLAAAPMGPELDRSSAAIIRKKVLSLLEGVDGVSPTLASLTEATQWNLPYRRTGGIPAEHIEWIAREAEWLGITGQGALSTYGKLFLAGEDLGVVDADLPKTVDHILIQSDNTAIAPGPLEHKVSQELDLIADIESRGAATVFRFSEASLRRGLDHGRTGEEILAFLKKSSKTPVPQPLEYLIGDISKKHGKLRVGNASSFIRCEDTALITQIIKDKKVEALGLRRIAPEVLICTHDAHDAMNILRAAGYLPAGEDSQGLLLSGPRIQRAQSKARPPRIVGEFEQPEAHLLEIAIRTIRTGEKSSAKQSTLRDISTEALGSLPRTTANETLEILTKFLTEGLSKSLSIGYADNNGLVSHRIIDPLKISAGSLMARDHATGEVLTFRIPRITGVAAL